MESQPQIPKFRNNPENLYHCIYTYNVVLVLITFVLGCNVWTDTLESLVQLQ